MLVKTISDSVAFLLKSTFLSWLLAIQNTIFFNPRQGIKVLKRYMFDKHADAAALSIMKSGRNSGRLQNNNAKFISTIFKWCKSLCLFAPCSKAK